jgi:hypothetical protein
VLHATTELCHDPFRKAANQIGNDIAAAMGEAARDSTDGA